MSSNWITKPWTYVVPAPPCGDMFHLSNGICLATKVLYFCELKNNHCYKLTTKEAYELDALGLADCFQFTKAISFFSCLLPFISSTLLLTFPFPGMSPLLSPHLLLPSLLDFFLPVPFPILFFLSLFPFSCLSPSLNWSSSPSSTAQE